MKKRQYRSNQGKNPTRTESNYKIISYIFKLGIYSSIAISILYLLT